jgi:peroxiredoxin
MAQFESLVAEFESLGAHVAYIAAEKRNGIFKPVKFLEKNPISFPFVLDEDRRVTKEYGLYHRVATDALNIAHPATLVIDKSMMIRYLYRSSNQLDRAPIEEVLTAARRLRD